MNTFNNGLLDTESFVPFNAVFTPLFFSETELGPNVISPELLDSLGVGDLSNVPVSLTIIDTCYSSFSKQASHLT
jgi:hypothetical protein